VAIDIYMDLQTGLKQFILLCSLPANHQIDLIDNLPNDVGSVPASVTVKTNDWYALIYGSRVLFDLHFNAIYESDQSETISTQLNWLLNTICEIEDKDLWTRHGLKKAIAWQLVRKLAKDYLISSEWDTASIKIEIKELLEICDLDDIYD
jgi:hypothetical protein